MLLQLGPSLWGFILPGGLVLTWLLKDKDVKKLYTTPAPHFSELRALVRSFPSHIPAYLNTLDGEGGEGNEGKRKRERRGKEGKRERKGKKRKGSPTLAHFPNIAQCALIL